MRPADHRLTTTGEVPDQARFGAGHLARANCHLRRAEVSRSLTKAEVRLRERMSKMAKVPEKMPKAKAAAKPKNPAAAAKPKSPAEWAYDRLILYIRNFESGLDATHEIAMGFAGDEAGVLRIEGLGFYDPDILTFYGRDEAGAKTQLIQHVTQLSVTLRAVPKTAAEDAPPRRIGFHLAPGWLGGDSGDASV